MSHGRPAFKTYFLARQADLFPDLAYQAYLENRYPYLRAMREALNLDVSSKTPPGVFPANCKEFKK
ncbi:protein of unknown function [Sterolibacterium denitrificans]|uniref:Uncharacterized protein n=1 Tax=Sterolibacterium denitrificans TaxID=157592 RepID=A0A7Z7HRE0_9PROT|nr:hypothetical protein [Sterolibacterium denitrificans]SMB27281.1 protein of unknown function [Sterolibacterium denitrificans]